MPKSYGERIEKLKEQREQIERRLNALEQKATNKKWKRDTRR
jgi:prefoldin subunit 5